MADDGESLESWLNRATSPSNRREDGENILGFCDQVKREAEGPQISVKLLVHKIQSPQEWEALQALTVLEACMKNCGSRFHSEVGKFRFLNELVKYLGDQVSERVKTKVITMLYGWTVALPHEAKISEAYRMLKAQGVVLADPELPSEAALTPAPSPRPLDPVFADEKQSKKLAELLRSKKPRDLQEANQLIRNMVKENEVRIRKSNKQKDTLEAVKNSASLLNEMLAHFSPQGSADGDKELLKELYHECRRLQRAVIELATQSEDDDGSLGDILQASDDLCQAVSSYEKIVEGRTMGGEAGRPEQPPAAVRGGASWSSEILIDLADVDVRSLSEAQLRAPVSSEPWGPAAAPSAPAGPSAASADEELLSLGFDRPVLAAGNSTRQAAPLQALAAPNPDAALLDIFSSSVAAVSSSSPSLLPDLLSAARMSPTPTPTPTPAPAALLSGPGFSAAPVWTRLAPRPLLQPPAPGLAPPLGLPVLSSPSTPLGQSLPHRALLDPNSSTARCSSTAPVSLTGGAQVVPTAPPAKSHADELALRHPTAVLPPTQPALAGEEAASLSDVFVPLSAIKASQPCPVTVCDAHGIRFLLHAAADCPPGRPDVLVLVASILSTAPLPARDVVLQAAVPKTMKVRLQQPSGRELAPFNPIRPPAAITQVLLLANPLKGKVRLRYKLMFTLGSQPHTQVGEVNDFPSAVALGAPQHSCTTG